MQAVARRVEVRRGKAKAEAVALGETPQEGELAEVAVSPRPSRTMVSTGERTQPKRQSRSQRKGR
jgi:hypothetical protein